MKSSKPTGLPYLFLVLLTVFSFASRFVLANDVEESYTDLLVNSFDIRLSGFVSQSFVHSPHNKVPNQGLNGFETGLEFNVNLNKYSSIRGLINYDREKELEFNYLVWDTSYSLSERFTIGARVGKLFMPYGFYNDTRGNPESRQGITPPIHVIWPNNVDFYDNSFGVHFYMHGSLGDVNIDVEKGFSENSNLNPKMNYTFGRKGVNFDKFLFETLHIQLDWGKHRFRYDEIIPTAHYSLTDEYWETYFPPTYLAGDRFYNNKLYLFMRYFGYQYWIGDWSITLEQVCIDMNGKENYTGFEEVMEVQADSLTFRNVILSMEVGKVNTYLGYGWSLREQDKQSELFGLERGDSLYSGMEYYASDSFLIKAEVYRIRGTSFISYVDNTNKDKWKNLWYTSAFQIIYLF